MTFEIAFFPVRLDEPVTYAKSGATLSINGDALDLSVLADGDVLPAGAVASDWIVGPIERIGAAIHMTLRLPFTPTSPRAVRFPEPVTVTADGDIALPSGEPEAPPDISDAVEMIGLATAMQGLTEETST